MIPFTAGASPGIISRTLSGGTRRGGGAARSGAARLSPLVPPPRTGEPLSFEAPPPPSLLRAWEALKSEG